ncbi:MAG: hypothetical protein ACKVS5_15685 [Parvularculaceae bacterium]
MRAPDKQTPARDNGSNADKSRRSRNLAIALCIIAFVLTIYAVTILRIGGNIAGAP